ncbi:MAG TPA: protein kinase, partial [Gemmataceae bacterium]|nr:protein kinase [Gemmataceae bacterium]
MPASESENYALLDQLAEEFAARYRGGERPSLKEYTDRYPEMAEDIRELFPAMVQMEGAEEDRREVEEPPAREAALPRLEQLGDYRIVREVGKGGMGIVYEAEQVSLGRHVALKVLPQKMLLDAKAKRRFEREAKAAAKLHHTNIVPIFGVGEHDGLPYYVMQFIQGLGLDEVLEELNRLQGKGGPATRTMPEGALQVSRKEVSAANVARSLLTGEFHGSEDSSSHESSAPSISDTGRLSDSFTVASSSVKLPGQA